MKVYEKPDLSKIHLETVNLASLNQWLSDNNLSGAGITTYIVNS